MTKTDERKILAALASNQFKDALNAGATWTQLLNAGATWTQLLNAGATLTQLRNAGATLTQLRNAGATLTQLRNAGATWTQLRNAGATLTQKDIPVLKKPYSRMLAAIRAKKLIHDQRSFGPGTYGCDDFDPEKNVCKTPMCTAGHLVSMAGVKGYELLKKCGDDFSLAAGLIHMASRPDAPQQNFGSIPQEWAMAYIEERAAEEESPCE